MIAEHSASAQVFLADQCQLRHFDAAGFEACMTGRRLFLIGADIRSSPSTLPTALCMCGSDLCQNTHLCMLQPSA